MHDKHTNEVFMYYVYKQNHVNLMGVKMKHGISWYGCGFVLW